MKKLMFVVAMLPFCSSVQLFSRDNNYDGLHLAVVATSTIYGAFLGNITGKEVYDSFSDSKFDNLREQYKKDPKAIEIINRLHSEKNANFSVGRGATRIASCCLTAKGAFVISHMMCNLLRGKELLS